MMENLATASYDGHSIREVIMPLWVDDHDQRVGLQARQVCTILECMIVIP